MKEVKITRAEWLAELDKKAPPKIKPARKPPAPVPARLTHPKNETVVQANGPIGLNPEQAARALSISKRTLSTLTSNRDSGIPFVKLGKRVIFPRERLQAWLESRIVGPR